MQCEKGEDIVFGCKSRGAAVMMCIFLWMECFMDRNPSTINSQTRIARDFMKVKFFKSTSLCSILQEFRLTIAKWVILSEFVIPFSRAVVKRCL